MSLLSHLANKQFLIKKMINGKIKRRNITSLDKKNIPPKKNKSFNILIQKKGTKIILTIRTKPPAREKQNLEKNTKGERCLEPYPTL